MACCWARDGRRFVACVANRSRGTSTKGMQVAKTAEVV